MSKQIDSGKENKALWYNTEYIPQIEKISMQRERGSKDSGEILEKRSSMICIKLFTFSIF